VGSCPTCGKRFPGASFCPEDGSALVAPTSAPLATAADGGDRGAPLTIDRYRVLEKIGEGGMSEVFEAEHIHLGKKVALKLLRRELASDAQAVERFRREARTTSTLGHPNVVHVIDFGHAADGSLYLAMEWLSGETLAARLEEGPLPQDLALEVIEQVCDGLAAAHAAGVVHRDMKPANVFLAHDGRGALVAKVLDFGIAKLAMTDSSLTRTGTFVGTPDYIAPEQALGEEVDGRADVYSVGVMLYQLLTGTVPFSGDTFMAVIHAHTMHRPEPPSQRAPERGIWSELEALVLRCLEKEPSRRFGSIAELGAAVHQARGGSEVSFYDRLRASGTDPELLAPPAEPGVTTARVGQLASEELAAPPALVAAEEGAVGWRVR
jgi:eukaryotic-like serine/threonine-protein kinase